MFNKLYVKIKENIIQVIMVLLFIFILLGFYIKLPYTIYTGGGTQNLSSNVLIVNEEVNTGEYKSLYVTTTEANLFSYLIAKINKNWDLVRNKNLSINEETYDEIFERDKIFLKQSESNAIKIAFEKASKDYKIINNNIYIIGSDNSDIKIGEIVKKVDNKDINSIDDIHNIVNDKNIGDECILETIKDGKSIIRTLQIKEIDSKKVIGIYIINVYDIQIEPEIKIKKEENEGGSSGGLMLALTIYDKITEEDLSNGMIIAGTGTIEEDGSIGKIDGLKYKMLGLSKEKYDVFFIPYKNKEEADEINEKYNLNMKYVPVKTFDEAVDYLLNVNN